MKRVSITAAAGVLFAVIALQGAQAQTKPDKLVTRDELRACMNSESDLVTRRKTMEDRAARQRDEAAALQAEGKELKEEQQQLAEAQKSMERFERKVKAHNARIQAARTSADSIAKDLDAFNQALTAHNEKCGGISYSKEDKDAILKERAAAGK
jgi:DNA repair exonuclease SbcCD ATPase subunit